MPADPAIDVEACRSRQRRLLDVMVQRKLDLAVVMLPEHVQWLAGPRYAWCFYPAAAIDSSGRVTLISPGKNPPVAAADDLRSYEAQWLSTLRNDQRAASSAVLADALRASGAKRIGVEFSAISRHFTEAIPAEYIDIEPELFRLRRRKDADELARLRRAIAATGAMYAKSREVIRPGVNELDVYSALQQAAVTELGEINPSTGNDWASGERGGPPRPRAIAAGELYILDLGPSYRGYFADNCRVVAVSGQPTDAQQRAWRRVCEAFDIVREMVRPGTRCRDLYAAVHEHLNAASPWVFDHHLGHGIGLFPHEAPHLNPNWDDTFAEGEVFACEPGLYGDDLHAGIRLENNYLVTASGVELLSDFPLELAR